MRTHRPIVLIAWLLAATAQAQASTLYVRPDGTDRADGSTMFNALRTISEAARRAAPGDVIELGEGVYEGAVISNPGRADAWIRMQPHAGQKAVIQGSGRGPTIYFYHRSCDEDRAPGIECQPMFWELRGLTVRGSPGGDGDGYTVKIDTPQVRLVENDLCCARADIVKLVRTADDVAILGNRIHDNAAPDGANAQGVDIVGADRTWVAFNHVHDIPSIGMYAKGNARNTVFEHNLLERIASNGIMLGQSTDAERLVDGKYESYDGVIRDNLLSAIGWACLATASSMNVHIHHNTCIDTGLTLHGAVLVSNESEIGQAGRGVAIDHNLFIGRSRLPMIKVVERAMEDPSTLRIDRNLYWTRDGAAPRFTLRDRGLESVPIERWRSATGQDRNSRVADPGLGGEPPTPRIGSPALDTRWLGGPTDDGCAARPPRVGARPPCPR